MDLVLFASAFFSFMTFLLFIHHFVRDSIRAHSFHRNLPLSLLVIVSLVFSVVVFFLSFGLFSFSSSDLLFILVGKLFFESLTLSLVLFVSSRKRSLFFPYLVILGLLVLSFFDVSFFHLLFPSLLVIMLVSYVSFSPFHKSLWDTPLLYVLSSFFLYISLLLFSSFSSFFLVFSSFFFLLFARRFTVSLRSSSHFDFFRSFHYSSLFDFFRHVVFIIVLSNFVFIGSVGVHEAGHALTAWFVGCDSAMVLFSFGDAPHTLSQCVSFSFLPLLLFSGFLFSFIVSLLLFFSGGRFIREIAVQVFSFNLMISFTDFLELGLSEVVVVSLFLLGVVSSLLSIGLLANARTSHL